MATLSSDLIARTQSYLFAGARESLNLLSGAHTSTTTTFTFTYDLGEIVVGSYVSVDVEVVYVWAVDTTAKTATVQRGMLGSTAVSHLASAVTTANPKFSDYVTLNAINDEMAAMSSPQNGLYQMLTVAPTYNGAVNGYDLTAVTSLIDVYAITYDDPGPNKQWPDIPFRVQRNANTTDFPSGFAVILKAPAQPGATVRIQYKAPFTAFTTTAQDAQTYAGLPATANDLPPLGAALRLASVREVQRNFNEAQGGTRRAEEVPPGAQLTGARGLRDLYVRRLSEERARLLAAYPPRRSWF